MNHQIYHILIIYLWRQAFFIFSFCENYQIYHIRQKFAIFIIDLCFVPLI